MGKHDIAILNGSILNGLMKMAKVDGFKCWVKRISHFTLGLALLLMPKAVVANDALSTNAMSTSQIEIKVNNELPYLVLIAKPQKAAPKKGWPVVILLDGNRTLPIAKDFAPDALLIGIGYPTEKREDIIARRYYDLTPHAPADKIPFKDGEKAPDTGGEVAFRNLITKTILPRIKKDYPVDDKQITLFGHSLGGLFVMNTLISDDRTTFNTFCAADPSIWWNGHQFMTDLKAFRHLDTMRTRLLIEVSGQRTVHKNIDEAQKKRINDLRSGPNGKDVSVFLQENTQIKTTFHRFEDKNHGTMIAPSIKDCLNFSLNEQFKPHHSN